LYLEYLGRSFMLAVHGSLSKSFGWKKSMFMSVKTPIRSVSLKSFSAIR